MPSHVASTTHNDGTMGSYCPNSLPTAVMQVPIVCVQSNSVRNGLVQFAELLKTSLTASSCVCRLAPVI